MTRDLSKIEALTRHMKESDIDVYLLQETWLLHDTITNICGITAIFHGPEISTSRCGSGGLAILLGPRAQRA